MSNWNNLNDSISTQDFLTPGKNQVVQNLTSGQLSPAQGIGVIQQYFYLVSTITQFLILAMTRIPVLKAKRELRRNLGEELGSRTRGETHQEILERYLLQELGIPARVLWNEPTRQFIVGLLEDFNVRPVHFVAGMVYALEATACPELKVVAKIINGAAQKEVICLHSLEDSSQVSQIKEHGVNCLQDFLACHTLDFEVGHESGLRETLATFAEENWAEFEEGFHHTLEAMRTWWLSLSLD